MKSVKIPKKFQQDGQLKLLLLGTIDWYYAIIAHAYYNNELPVLGDPKWKFRQISERLLTIEDSKAQWNKYPATP